MADNDYRIELGIGLKDSDFNDIKTKIKSLENDAIKIKLDTQTVDGQINDIKKQLKDIGKDNSKNSFTINTSGLEDSLGRVELIIKDIRDSFSTLDGKSGMKSLLSSVNQITAALGKADKESESLVKSLSALSKKDFNFNLNIKAGNANRIKSNIDYGDEVRNNVIPELEKRVQYFRKALGGFENAKSELTKLMTSRYGDTGATRAQNLIDSLGDDSSLSKQMNAYKRYLEYMQEIAFAKNRILENDYNYQFSIPTEDLIKNAKEIQAGTKDVEESFEKLKQVVGGGIGAEELSGRLQPILSSLGEIKKAITDLSKNTSFTNLTDSFNRLSKALEDVMSNATAAQQVLKDGFGISTTNPIDSSVGEISSGEVIKTAQQTGQKIGDVIEKALEQSLDIDDAIDEQVLSLMNQYKIVGDKGSDAFKEIRQAVDGYRNGTSDISQVTSTLAKNINQVEKLDKAYYDLDSTIKETNRHAKENKGVGSVYISDKTRADLGDDYSKLRSKLGIAFSNKHHEGEQVFDTYVKDIIKDYGHILDIRNDTDYAEIIKEITSSLDKVKRPKTISGDDLFKNNIDINEMKNAIDSAVGVIDSKQLSQLKDIGFDTSNFEEAASELTNVKNRLQEIDSEIGNYRDAIGDIDDVITKDSLRDLGIDLSDDNLEAYRGSQAEHYRDNIDALEEEKAILQSSLPILEEKYNREKQLLAESYQQIRETVEQRKLEAQQVQDTANTVVQSTEKIAQASTETVNIVEKNAEKQKQAVQEIAKTYEKISRDVSLVRDDVGFQKDFEQSNQAAQEAQRHFQELLADEKAVISVTEQFDDSNMLQSFAVNIKRASGEVETLRYAMQNLAEEDDEEDNWRFTYQGGSTNDRTVEKQLEKHIKKANDLQTKLDKIKASYSDVNAAKPIKKSEHISALSDQYDKVTAAIEKVKNADNATFSSMVSNAQKEIAVLESMTSEFRNAETVATSLRSKDISTVKDTYSSKLDVLISKMRKDGVYTSGFESGAENLRSILSSATDASGLVKFLNGLDKLDAGYKRASASAKEFNQSQKVGINVSGLESKITNLQRISPEIDKFETEINGAKVSVQSLLKDLGQVKTQGDFSVVNTKFKAFVDSAEAAGISIKENSTDFEKLKSLAKEISNLRIDIFKADDTFDISKATVELGKLNNEYDELFAKTKGSLSNRQLSQLSNLVDQGDTKVIREFNNEINELIRLQNQIENTRFEIGKLEIVGDKNNEIETLKRQLKELEDIHNRLNHRFMEKAVANGDFFGVNDFSELENGIANATKNAENRLERFKSQYADARAELAKKIKVDIDVGNFDDDLSRMYEGLNKLSFKSEDLEKGIRDVENALKAMKEASITNEDGVLDTERLIRVQEQYNEALERTNNLIKVQSREERALNEIERLEDDKKLFQSNIDGWLTKNSAATERFGAQLLELRAKAQNCDRVELNHLIRQFKMLDREADKAGLKMLSLGDRIKTKFKEYSAYFSVAEVFMYATQGLKDMFNQVVAIDTAMTELKKVTNETEASYNYFLGNAATKAKELGTTIDGLVNSTADFARLGYGFEDAQGLAEVANVYAVVGDDIDSVETATQSLISTLTAFKDEANGLSDSDFAMSIVDKMNEVANNYAISSGGIGEALQRSASSMMAANNSLDETIALITAANTVVQDPDAVGTAFKTISMRIRGAKTEMEEAGLETDGMADSTAKLREEMLALSGVDIMLNAKEFKSTYQIMEELADRWQDLSDIQQASVTELIAGKRQGNIVSSLMNNFDIAQNALETSLNSSGSAMKEHAKYMDSLEARMSQLKAAWQGLSQTFMNSDFLKTGISFITELVSLLDKLIDKFGTLGTIGFGASIFGLFKLKGTGAKSSILDAFSFFGSVVSDAISSSGKLSSKFKDVGAAASMAGGQIGKKLTSSLSGWVTGIGIAVAAAGLLYSAYKNVKEEAAKARQETIESSETYLNASSNFEQAYIKYSGKSELTADEETELAAAIKGTTDALDDKSSTLHNLVNSSNDYLASLEQIAEEERKIAKEKAIDKKEALEKNLTEAAIGYEKFDGSEVNISLGTSGLGNLDETDKVIQKVAGKYFKQTQQGVNGAKFNLTLDANADTSEILDYYYTLLDIEKKLKDAGLDDTAEYENVTAAIGQMTEAVDAYANGVYDAVKAQQEIPKTVDQYLEMRKAILTDDEVKELSIDTRKSFANTLDAEYGEFFDLTTAEVQSKKLIGILDEFGETEASQVETFLNMRTAVNSNECTVGEYLEELDKVSAIDNEWSEDSQKEFTTSFGLDTDKIKKQYDNVYNYLSRNYLEKLDTTGMKPFDAQEYKNHEIQKIKDILSGLSANELAAVVSIKGEIDWENTNTDKILEQIKKEAEFIEAMNYTIAIDVETESLDALNSALSESVSGAGLSSESIAALKGRYAELASQGYDLSAMFEETSNGIHLNKNAVNEFEQVLASQKLSETDGKLDVLKKRYDELTNEINNCTDAGERASLYSEQQEVAQKINDLATLASQYKGLTSAYTAWQNAESAGQERDMYESIIEGFENIGDEISRGWYDDGTIKFLELITGQTDLAGKSASELKEIWNSLDDTIKGTSYSVKDFFTTDEDGNSTSTGAYNFLKAVEELGKNGGLKALEGKNIEDLIVRNDKGKIVEFDFDVVGGDEAVAKALGVSEEMVQIIQRTLDDAGFVVTLDGKYTLLADLKTSAEEANNTLKKLQSEGLEGLKGVDLNFDFEVDTVQGYQEQLEKATTALDKFRDKNGKLKTDKNGNLVEGAKEALEIAEYYTAAMDKLTEPKFMQIDTSTVDEELQEPIEKIQEIGDLCKEKHLVTLTGDTKEIEEVQGEINRVAKEIEELDPEVKAKIGIDEDWDAQTIADKIEKGEIEVPAELKLDVQMSEDIKDMRLLMMRELGLVSENEVKLKIGYEIDDSTVDRLEDKEQEVVIKYIEENEEAWNKLSEEEREAVVKIVADGTDIESWEAEEKEALVKYVVDGGEVDDWTPEQKEAFAKYLVDGGDVEGWSPEAKDAFVKYLVDGGDPDKFDPDDKESWVVYKKDSSEPDSYVPRNPNALVKYGKDSSVPDSYDPKDPDATVKYGKDSLIPDNYIPLDPPATVIFDKDTSAIDTYDPPNFVRTVTYNIEEVAAGGKSKAAQRTGADPDGKGTVNGTANVNGTTGRAFKQGSWGTKNSGTALVGELGRETLVRDGRYYTIGDTGAEFIKYQKGDIIFNHKQTDELFKNGKVTSGGGRAKALVNGTAFVQGTAFGSGSGGGAEAEVKSIVVGTNSNTGKSYTKSTDNDDFEETFDWIEIAISRVERAIDQLDQKANNIYKSWSSRNTALTNEISKIGEEINLQQKAYNEYMAAANAVGLSSSWASKVRNGTIDISTVKDEALADKIKDYQDFYEKALDCKDAIEELKETEASLYAQRVENVSTQYEGILGVIEHEKNMIEEYISQSETNAWLVSENYYKALKANEEQTISELENQREEMLDAFNTAMNSGTITKNSEAYYDMVNSIDEVTLAIQESQTAIEEYEQTIEQLKWEQFDLLQDKISAVTDETEFLIELMSSDKLFDDNGQLTNKGSATMGLHGVAYNTYMYQADQAKAQAEKLKAQLDAELKKGLLDTELEERYREMVSLQQEYILAAEDEKNAIRDLVEEGIDYELEALQEKIDLYNEELESAEDLYQYNKKIQEQTQDIASLEKQLAAYQGDNSEEARAKVQELKISLKDAKSDLEDTERDWDISSQQKMLNDLYSDYELTLNTRLDNLDALVEQMIAEINADAGIISDTIGEVVGNVNYELSESMSAIWDKNTIETNNVIASYGDKIEFAQTTTNGALTLINNNLLEVIGKLDKKATTNVKKATTSSSSKSTTTKKTTTTTTKKSTTSGDGTPRVGDKVKFVSGKYYYDSYGMKPLGSQKQGQYVYITNINKKGSHPYHISTGTKLGSGDLGWLKLNQISGYAVGKQNFAKDEIAWTQENGREFIVRPSDGAILTPVAKGDSVLTSAASNNIWDMANNPVEFIKDNLNLGATNVPNNSNVNNSIVQNFENITFSMPNVHGYNDLLTEMQRDPKFEKLILSMTVDQIAGKSKLAKGKSIR